MIFDVFSLKVFIFICFGNRKEILKKKKGKKSDDKYSEKSGLNLSLVIAL